MSNTKLEQLRLLHAEIELLRREMFNDLQSDRKGHKELLKQDHRMKLRLDRIVENTKKIIPAYQDENKPLYRELQYMEDRSYIQNFYTKYSEITRYHKANENIPPTTTELPHLQPKYEFTGEEWFGRFVDMNQFYTKYINLKVFKVVSRCKKRINVLVPKVQSSINNNNNNNNDNNNDDIEMVNKIKYVSAPIDYKVFLDRFREFWRIKNKKKNNEYVQFSFLCENVNMKRQDFINQFYNEVLDYLVNFFRRTHPLAPTQRIVSKCEEFFESDWRKNKIEGWQFDWTEKSKNKFNDMAMLNSFAISNKNKKNKKNDKKQTNDSNTNEENNIINSNSNNNNNNNNSSNDIEMKDNNSNIGPITISIEKGESNNIINNDEYDSMEELDEEMKCYACNKFFKNKNTMKAHFKSNKHLKTKKIALLESKVGLFSDLLNENICSTKSYIEKKLTMSYEEISRELLNEEQDNNESDYLSEDEEHDPTILNPLKIPLDFDGKPIPYWLYKFRGLNRYFKCEICGDMRYRGPRAFERHFREWRHAHGMRKLNIPNTKDFHMITKIADARRLYSKLQSHKQNYTFNPEDEEEFEDKEGNVFKKSMFEQLKRQGVIDD